MSYLWHILLIYSVIVCLHVRRVNPLICSFSKKTAERLGIRNQCAINMVLYLSTTSIHRCILTLSRGMVKWNSGQVGFRFFSLISFSGGRGGVQGQHVVWVLFEVKKIRQASRKHCRMRINAYHIDLYIHLQNLGRVFRCVKLVKANSEHTMAKQCLKIRKVEGVFIFQDLLYFLERVHPVHTLKHRTDSSCK